MTTNEQERAAAERRAAEKLRNLSLIAAGVAAAEGNQSPRCVADDAFGIYDRLEQLVRNDTP